MCKPRAGSFQYDRTDGDDVQVTKPTLPKIPATRAASEFLELFFPIHYTVGMTVEETLCNKVLSRHQAIILWIIRSQGGDQKRMNRKIIEQDMADWYDITSSAISKAIRSLAKPPLKLVTIMEDPESGREKVVALTPKGERFVDQMYANGRDLIKLATDQMTPEEVDMGIYMFKRIAEIFASTPALSPRGRKELRAAE